MTRPGDFALAVRYGDHARIRRAALMWDRFERAALWLVIAACGTFGGALIVWASAVGIAAVALPQAL